jgi:hypothetical protein
MKPKGRKKVSVMAQKRKTVHGKGMINEQTLTASVIFLSQLVNDMIIKLSYLTPKFRRDDTIYDLQFKIKQYFGSGTSFGILSRLYGYHDGYPYSVDGVASIFGMNTEDVEKVRQEWIAGLLENELISLPKRRVSWLEKTPCKSCGVKLGELHEFCCVAEECPYCRGKAFSCPCSYRILQLGWGGRTAKEWRAMRKKHEPTFDRNQHIRPLTSEERRKWGVAIMKKGPIPYGQERKFQ